MNIDKLSSDNYSTWAVQMRSVLITLDYWQITKEKLKIGSTAEETASTESLDQKALAMITLSIKPSELIHIKNCKTSHDAWTTLEKIYQPTGPARKVNLFKKLIQFKFKSGEKFSGQINDFCTILGELKEIDVNMPEELESILLLCSLPDCMENFVVAVEAQDCLPKIENLKSKILEEEQRKSATTTYSNENAFTLRNAKAHFKSNDKYITESTVNQHKNFKNITCFECGRKGHMKVNCKVKRKTNAVFISLANCSSNVENCSKNKNNIWLLDSGASAHMCFDEKLFTSIEKHSQRVMLATGETITSSGIGTIYLQSNFTDITLKNVLLVKELNSHILSVSKILSHNNSVIFEKNFALIKNGNEILLRAKLNEGIFEAEIVENTVKMAIGSKKEKISEFELWHKRFGHLNWNDLCYMQKKSLVMGIKLEKPNYFSCMTCALCKIQTKPFNSNHTLKTKQLLEVIHTDICGPIKVNSMGGAAYFITFIDDFSRYVSTFFLKQKSDALKVFKEYVEMAENQTGSKVKILRSDNGSEYTSHEFQNMLKEKGICHQRTISYTPQQNGVAERMNRTLVEMSRCLLQESNLPQYLWAEAINTSTYLRNRSSTRILKDKTPFECWFGRKPVVSHFKIFGCDAVVLNKKPGRSKMLPKGEICTFVGYSSRSKGYRLYNKEKRTIVEARDVIFFEEKLIESGESKSEANQNLSIFEINNRGCEPDEIFSDENPVGRTKNEINNHECESNEKTENSDTESEGEAEEHEQNLNNEVDNRKLESKGRGRPKIIRTGLPGRPRKEYIPNEEKVLNDAINVLQNVQVVKRGDPSTVNEAMSREDWCTWENSMRREYESLVKNDTWDLVQRPINKNIIGCKWVFTTKRNPDDSIAKYKARLVAKGYAQKYNVDYFQTFAPVVRHTSIRILLAIAVQKELYVNHIDIVSAFLNGELEEDVYMEQPEMFIDQRYPDMVCKLKKSIYGLKQAGRDWNIKITDILLKIGFERCVTDNCIYKMNKNNEINIIGLYVDDMIIACSSTATMEKIIKEISKFVETVDRGPLSYFLGMEITRKSSTGELQLHQRKYVNDVLNKWKMQTCKPAYTPLPQGFVLDKCDGSKCKQFDEKLYQSLIGELNYLATVSRPDIAHAISKLSQFCKHPHKQHFEAAKHVLRYLKATQDGLVNYLKNISSLICFTDADWGADITDRKSYNGFVVYLNGCPIAWESKKQCSVSLSSTEAEYIALSQGVKEVSFIRSLLDELGLQEYLKSPAEMRCDNQGAKFLVQNPVAHKRSKHIDIRYHYIRENYNTKQIDVIYVRSEDNVADIFTKCLGKQKHLNFCKLLKINF